MCIKDEDEIHRHLVSQSEVGQRLDVVLSRLPEVHSRAAAQRLIKSQRVQVNDLTASGAYKVRLEDQILYSLPPPETSEVLPEPGLLDILYEDASLIVVNKMPGVVVHPAPGHATGTLVNFLLYHCQDLAGIGGVKRPGIVHRLDKDTSGVLVVAKSDEAHTGLVEQFQVHSIHRKYQALVWGGPLLQSGTIKAPIGRNPHNRKKMAVVETGKPATTHWKVLTRFRYFTLLECRLETGRTHQIRTHLTSQNMPLLGDPQYGSSRLNRFRSVPPSIWDCLSQFDRQALHAETLGFVHPIRQEYLEFHTPPPSDFREVLNALNEWEKHLSGSSQAKKGET